MRLSESEAQQLRTLYEVYKRPTIAGTWRRVDCNRLKDLGLAEKVMYGGIQVFSISPAGIELCEQPVSASKDGK